MADSNEEVQTPYEEVEANTWSVAVQITLPKVVTTSAMSRPLQIDGKAVQAIVENAFAKSGLVQIEAMIVQLLPEGKGMVELALRNADEPKITTVWPDDDPEGQEEPPC